VDGPDDECQRGSPDGSGVLSRLLETPAPGIAGGFKGAGEAGATGAPAAILNAVNDALARSERC